MGPPFSPLHSVAERVLASISEGVCVVDAGGVIVYSNPAHDRVLGYGPGELMGRSVRQLCPEPTAEVDRKLAQIR